MRSDEHNTENSKVAANHKKQYSVGLEQQPKGAATLLGDVTLEYVKLQSHGRVGDVVTFCMLGPRDG